ncbi:MAG: RNA polymerase sigma factor [Bacteroidetes bacterium]|nr:RNA polymerase sigma factor [Bacteroidota bacterium]
MLVHSQVINLSGPLTSKIAVSASMQTMQAQNLQSIIAGCIKNERVCQQQLFKMYGSKLLGICYRYTRNREEAEDLCQEAMVKIFLNLKGYDYRGSFEGWIKRITINTVFEFFRKKKILFDTSDYELVVAEDQTPDYQANAYELAQLIQQLPPATRLVFNMYAIEGYKHAEIAQMANISEGTSKWHYANARKLLQQMLNDKK